MSEFLDTAVTLFQGAKRAEVHEHTTLRELLRRACRDADMQAQGERLAALAADPNEQATYSRLKELCLGFVLGDFSYRDMASMNSLPNLIGLDVDHLTDEQQLRTMLDRLREWKHCALAFPSLSRRGLRVMVRINTDTETFSEDYRQVARSMCRWLNIEIKRDLKDRLDLAGFSPKTKKEIISSLPHGDDSVNDYARLWFISGLRVADVYVNAEAEVFVRTAAKPAVKPTTVLPATAAATGGGFGTSTSVPAISQAETNAEMMDLLLSEIEGGGVDITQGVREWYKIGQAIYATFGSSGLDYFVRISRNHPDFTDRDAQREYDRIARKHKPGRTSLGSLIFLCRQYGIEVAGAKLEAGGIVQSLMRPPGVRSGSLTMRETERSVLTCMIVDPGASERVSDLLPSFSAECFATEDYAEAYRTVRELRLAGKEVDPMTVAARTHQRGFAAAAERIPSLLTKKYYPDSLIDQARMLYDEYRYDRVRGMGPSLLQLVDKRLPLADIVSGIRQLADVLEDDGVRTTEFVGEDIASEVTTHLERQARARELGEALEGIPTGLRHLDAQLKGLVDSRLYVIAGRPAMGKTSLVISMIYNMLVAGYRVLFYSLEMTMHDVSLKLAALHSGIPLTRLQSGDLTEQDYERLSHALNEVCTWSIIIDDDGDLGPSQQEARTARHMRNGGVDIVVCDYLQFMKHELPGGENENVGNASKRAKNTAKRHNIPYVDLSQLNRAVEARGGDKRPHMSDLRGSGEIEQHADVIIFCYRPEYYKITEDEQGNSLVGVTELIIGKNRHGSTDDVRVHFDPTLTKFEDMEESDFDLLPGFGKTLRKVSVSASKVIPSQSAGRSISAEPIRSLSPSGVDRIADKLPGRFDPYGEDVPF